MEAQLLVVDDEEHLRASLQEYFEREGFGVATAQNGIEALSLMDELKPNLIILDVHLPHLDGLEVCRAIRQKAGHAAGIIMISGAKRELLDRVVGLEVGADLYLTKPFETRELLAQVRALLRRIKAQGAPGEAAGWLVIDDYLRVHPDRRHVMAGGQQVHLTRLEFDLFMYLADRPGVPCARADLLDAVWQADEAALDLMDSAVNTCVARLRAKIEPDLANPCYIQSVHGIGYRLKAP